MKCSFNSIANICLTNKQTLILINAKNISIRSTFEVTFQQWAGTYLPPDIQLILVVSFGRRRAIAYLFIMFSAWTSQKFMKFSLQVDHSANLKHWKSTKTANRPAKTTKSKQWRLRAQCTLDHRDVLERLSYRNCLLDIGRCRAGGLITKVSTPEWYICIWQCP